MGNLASALTLQSEEAALIAELRAGSEDAFAWLIARYHQPIYSLLARTVHDRADAADLTQEVFVKVFRGVSATFMENRRCAPGFTESHCARPRTSDAGGCGTNSRKFPSSRKSRRAIPESPVKLKDTLVDSGESPFEMAVHEENRARVEAALRQVPEPFRTTLILRDIEGFVYEEVAEIQGVNLGTVKSRLVRGRAYLKTLLTATPKTKDLPNREGLELPLGEEAR